MSISIVIPNYNGSRLLKTNLESVVEAIEYYLNHSSGDAEIRIIDDKSTDDSMEVLQELKGRLGKKIPVFIEQNERNYGFSTTVNRGVEKARGDVVVLLNTDVRPDKNFLLPLLSHFVKENVFAVACMDKSIEGDKTVLRGRGIGRWQRGFLTHAAGSVDKHTTLWASGGSSAFQKSVWDKLGGLNELYNPFYWEDIDLSYRALKAGYVVIFDSKSTVTHEHEKGAIKSKYSLNQVKKIAYRNQFIFVWSNVTDVKLCILHLLCLPYHMVKAFFGMDWAFFSGFFSALTKIGPIRKQRKKMIRIFRKSDVEIQIIS